jgi:hypothetical protein
MKIKSLIFRDEARMLVALHWNDIIKFLDTRCGYADYQQLMRFFYEENPEIGVAIVRNFKKSMSSRIDIMFENMSEPKLTVIYGGLKGSGKTCFAYWAAEEMKDRGMIKKVCLYRPLTFSNKLPGYFYPAWEDNQILPESFVIYDEAQINISSRRSTSKQNIDFVPFLTLQRHRGFPAMIIQQSIHMTDINVRRLADILIFKEIGTFQFSKEHQRNDPLSQFLSFFRPTKSNQTTYMDVGFKDIFHLETGIPSFWDIAGDIGKTGMMLSQYDAVDYVNNLAKYSVNIKDIQRMLLSLGVRWEPGEIKNAMNSPKKMKEQIRKLEEEKHKQGFDRW